MNRKVGIEIIYKGKKIEEVCNIYQKKIFINMYEFYQIVLEPFAQEIQSGNVYIKIYIDEIFKIDKVELISNNTCLKVQILNWLKPYTNEQTIIKEENESQPDFFDSNNKFSFIGLD